MVGVVASAFLCFTLLDCGGGGAGAAGGAGGEVAHSVGHADVDEALPVVDGGSDVHDGAAGLSLGIDVVEFAYVLFAVC